MFSVIISVSHFSFGFSENELMGVRPKGGSNVKAASLYDGASVAK